MRNVVGFVIFAIRHRGCSDRKLRAVSFVKGVRKTEKSYGIITTYSHIARRRPLPRAMRSFGRLFFRVCADPLSGHGRGGVFYCVVRVAAAAAAEETAEEPAAEEAPADAQ